MAYIVFVDGRPSECRISRKLAIEVAYILQSDGRNVTAVESDLCHKAIPMDRLFVDTDPQAVKVPFSRAFHERSLRAEWIKELRRA